ncbi:MAG: hypothetical protein ABIL25_05700 [candidate division WOR-3 bacterium]
MNDETNGRTEQDTALLPVSVHDALRALVAVESGANRVAIIAQVDALMDEWARALGEPGHVAMTALARCEKGLRLLARDFRERTLTRRDRQRAWKHYHAAWDEIYRRKEQASIAARSHFQVLADGVLECLKTRGPRAALGKLRDAHRQRTRFLLSKQHAEEVEQIFATLLRQVKEEGIRQHPVRRRLDERRQRACEFLARVERAANRIEARLAESRRRWEVEDNPLRAALLKQQIADDESEHERIREKLDRVRKEIERLDQALKRFQPLGTGGGSG